MGEVTSKLDLLREEVFAGKLSRRSVLKRATVLGLSAPIIASLLAACGGDDDDDDDATSTTGAGASTPSAAAGEPTATTAAEATAAPGEPTATTGAASDATATTATAPEATATTAAEAGGGGLLKLLWWQAPTILNSHLAQGTKDYDASSLILNSLANYDKDGELVAALAAEIPSTENGGVAADAMSVTWKLKEGVTWHDGEPFTSADVRFTWEYVTHPDMASPNVQSFANIASIDTPDDFTATINFDAPKPDWFTPFTGAAGMVVPEHILSASIGAEAVNAEFNLAPIGTGAFKLVEFKPGDVVVLDRNENYWDPGKPFFDSIEMKGGGDATSAARAALQSGEVDFSWNLQVEAEVLAEMIDDSVGVLVPVPSSNVERILVNFTNPNEEVDGARSEPSTKHPFFQYLEVRQAITYAMDRETIATQFYGPAGSPTTNTVAGPERFVSPNTTGEFDVAKGNEMLEAAGWTLDGDQRSKDGVEMSVLYQTSTNPVRQKTQEVVKAALEEMGIKTELKAIDAGVYFSSDAGNPDTASHFYADLEMFTSGATIWPGPYLGNYISIDPAKDLAQKANEWLGVNTHRWVNDEYNGLYTQLLTELDPAKQEELVIQMNDIIINDVADIALVQRAQVVGYSVTLKNVDPSGWDSNIWQLADWTREE